MNSLIKGIESARDFWAFPWEGSSVLSTRAKALMGIHAGKARGLMWVAAHMWAVSQGLGAQAA